MTPRPKDPPGFDAFWEIWPYKKAKEEACRWWRKNKPDDSELKMITDAVNAQIEERKAFADVGLRHADWKLPAGWLRDARWEDEIVMPAVAKATRTQKLPQFFGKQCYKCHMPARHKSQGSHGDSHYCIEHIPPKAMDRYRGQGYTRDDGTSL